MKKINVPKIFAGSLEEKRLFGRKVFFESYIRPFLHSFIQ